MDILYRVVRQTPKKEKEVNIFKILFIHIKTNVVIRNFFRISKGNRSEEKYFSVHKSP